MERRMLIAILLIVVIVIGIGGGAYYFFVFAPGLRPATKTLINQTIGEPQYLDPAVDYETAGGEIIQSVCETLLFYDYDSAVDIVPQLAESWSVTPDYLRYTFHLRQGITFHDGTPFNAYAMKYSIDRAVLINDPDSGAWILQQCIKGGATYAWEVSDRGNRTEVYEAAKAYLDLESVKVVDPYTLNITIDYMDSGGMPYPGFQYAIIFTAAAAVSPNYVYTHGGSAADAGSNYFGRSVAAYYDLSFDILANWSDPIASKYCAGVVPDLHNAFMDENMCGTGPFKFAEWTHQVRVVMEKNPDYWGANDAINDVTGDDDYWESHVAKVDRVIVLRVDEFGSRSLAIQAGDCDIAYWPVTNAPDIYDINTHSVLPAYSAALRVIAELPTLTITAASMNMNKTIGGVKPFSNLDFRLGFQKAFNYPAFMSTVVNGHGIRLRTCVPKGMLGYDPSVPLYNYTPSEAKTHLETAMAALGNPTLAIELAYNAGNDVRKGACLLLKDEINSYAITGLTLTVKEYDWPTFLSLIQTKQLAIFFVGWLPDYPDPDNYVFVYAHGSGTYAKRITYKNNTITALVEDAAIETNVTLRMEMYHEIYMELHQEAMYMWLYQPTNFHVERTWVTGWYLNPMHSGQPYWALGKP